MSEDTLVGKRLGKYLLVRLLGRGGMAEVYLAEHELLRSRVAVKVLPVPLSRNPDMVSRFLREARAAARLRHPHIVRIHDVGQEGGLNYFAMDYVEGSTLGRLISSQGPLPENLIIRLSHQVLSALGEAHQEGIIHRDIKPDNVIIDERGDAVVMDFGIARAGQDSSLPQNGHFLGTPYYASPEQSRGRRVDQRGDLYSVGVLMYEMTTGRVPFEGSDTAAVIYKHVHETPIPPAQQRSSLSPGLNGLILKLMAKNPDDRFSSANEAIIALDTLDPDGTRRAGAQTALRREADRRKQGRAREYLEEAASHLAGEKWTGALNLAEKALSLDPGSTGARQVMERAQAEQVRDERIRELTTRVKAHLDQGDQRLAAETLVELAGAARDKQGALSWLEKVQMRMDGTEEPEAVLQRGQAMEEAGLLEEAGKLYRALLARLPAEDRVEVALERVERRIEAQGHLTAGEERLRADDPAGAVNAFQRAVEVWPDNALAHEGLGRARVRLDRRKRVEGLCQRALEYLERGDQAQAGELLEDALDLDPDYPPVGDLLRRAGISPSQLRNHPLTLLSPRGEREAGLAEAGYARVSLPGKSRKVWLGGIFLFLALVAVMGIWDFGPQPENEPPAATAPGSSPAPPPPAATAPAAPETPPAAQPAPAPAASAAAEAPKPESLLERGQRLLEQGELGQAEKALSQAARENPADKKAAAALQDVRRLRIQVLLSQGEELMAAGDLSRARQAFEEALKLNPKAEKARRGLEEISGKLGAMAQAEREDRDRQEATRLTEEGYRLLKANELDNAAKAFNQARGLDPKNNSAVQGLEQVRARQKVIAELDRQAKARGESQQIAARGQKLLDKGDLAEAEKVFAQALKLNPENAEARRGMAEVDEIRQKRQKATAINQAKREVERGRALLAKGSLDQAEEAFGLALKLSPGLAEAQKGLEQAKGRRRGAALLERAQSAARAGQFGQARQWLKKAAAYPEARQEAQSRLASLDARQRQWERAQVGKRARHEAQAAKAAGIADFSAGRWESAADNLKKYLAVYPDDKSVAGLFQQAQKTHASYQVGVLEVYSEPQAQVFLDGRLVGETPLKLGGVPKGGHQVEVRAEGYYSQSKELDLKGGAVNGMSFTMVAQQ